MLYTTVVCTTTVLLLFNNDLLLGDGFVAASGLRSTASRVALAILFDGLTSFWSRIEYSSFNLHCRTKIA